MRLYDQWADIVLTLFHYQFASLAGGWVWRLRGKPYVVFAHGSLKLHALNRRHRRAREWCLRILEGANLRNALFVSYHALPNKIFEYLAAGIPIAVSDLPDMRRLAVDEDMGVVSGPKDHASLAHAVRDLIDDPATLQRKRANLMRAAADRYNWRVVRGKLVAFIRTS